MAFLSSIFVTFSDQLFASTPHNFNGAHQRASDRCNLVITTPAGDASSSHMYQVLPLLAPNLDLETLVSISQASKQLHDQCLDLPDQLLQSIVHQAMKQKQPKKRAWTRPKHIDSCCSSLAWLLGALSKRWGLMQLAARLDLQQALLAAEGDSAACYILIRAGARVTRSLILKTKAGEPQAWVYAYQAVCLSWGLPLILIRVLTGGAGCSVLDGLQNLDGELLFELASAAYKVSSELPAEYILQSLWLQPQREGWSSEQVFELVLLALEQEHTTMLRVLLRLPAAHKIRKQQYADLLILLLGSPYSVWMQEIAALVLLRVQWDQQLVDRLAAAIKFVSDRYSCRHCTSCNICTVMQVLSQSAADLPPQLLIGLLSATKFHEIAGSDLLLAIGSSGGIAEAAAAVAAVAAGIRGRGRQLWTAEYRQAFEQLLQQPPVQQLPLAEVQRLLLQAVRSSCREGLQCLLKVLPAAQEVTGEGLQQLLEAAVEGSGRSAARDSHRASKLVGELVGSTLPAVQQLGLGELQLPMMKCFQRDDYWALECLIIYLLAAAKQLPYAAIYELMLQAAALQASGCLLTFLKLVQPVEDIPLAVLQQVLPVLMSCSCAKCALTPAVVAQYGTYAAVSTCSVCSLLKAVAGNLAAADVWEVLVAAAKAPVTDMHLEGFASLPGVDELGEEQVEQLLMAAIEALPVVEREGEQSLLSKLEQLQGELLCSRKLSSAAVHKLMVACVGKAVKGGVGRLREEVGLQGEGWQGGLSPEQLRQLAGVAVRCGLDRPAAGWVAGRHTIECRPCLLVLAKLLPSFSEQQQVAHALWAAGEDLLHLYDVELEDGTNDSTGSDSPTTSDSGLDS